MILQLIYLQWYSLGHSGPINCQKLFNHKIYFRSSDLWINTKHCVCLCLCIPLGMALDFLKLISKFMFWFTFIVNLSRQFICDLWKKGPRQKLTIYKQVSDKSKKCLSVILKFCLSSLHCGWLPAYPRLM